MQTDEKCSWPERGNAGLVWLGQAGFWIETGQHRLLIDPYLSDSLAIKYAGRENDHQRMMAAPCAVADIPCPDAVLITHAHTDHMDPDTLGPLFARFPDIPFIVPRAKLDEAGKRIGEAANLIGVEADQTIQLLDGLTLTVFPAAHEKRAFDANGHDMFLGYGVESAGLRILHPGDTIPFPGLADRIAQFAPDVALLPVNGQDESRLAQGIPGNFTLSEALEICRDVPVIVPHHWGMFSFNTLDPEKITAAADACTTSQIVLPVCGAVLHIEAGDAGQAQSAPLRAFYSEA